MSEWLLPASAAAVWAGVLLQPWLVRPVSPWGLLVAGAAILTAAAFAAPRPAPRPGALAAAALLSSREPEPLTSVGPERSLASRWPWFAPAALLVVALTILGAGWAGLQSRRLDGSVLARISPTRLEARGILRVDPEPGKFGWYAIVRLTSVRWQGGPPVTLDETVWVNGDGSPPSAVRGDEVSLSGLAERPADAEFALSLRRRGIVATLALDSFERVGPSPSAVARLAQGARSFAADSMRRLFPEREAGLLMGLALGDDSALDPAIERDFRATGLGHLLVASGGNVAMILAPVLGLAILLRLPLPVKVVLALGTVAFFVVVTGAEPSVLRAAFMAGFTLLGMASGRPRSAASILGAAVLVLLLLDPNLVWSVGFRLSVAATAGMAALASPLAERIGWLPRPVALAVATSLSAQFGVTPVLLFQVQGVPGITLLANLLAFPLVEPAMLLGFAAAGAGRLFPPLGRVVAGVAGVLLRSLELLADRLARSPVPWLTTGGGASVLVVGFAAVLVVVWRVRTGRRLPRPVTFAALAAVPVLVLATALSAGAPSGLEVTFFDVGQGDAALVSSPGGARILIDGGPDEEQVASKLSALGVRRLDLVVASHPHADHVVGIPAVLSRFPVGTVLEPGCPDESPLNRELVRAFADEGVRVQYPRAGDAYSVGDLRIDVLSPPKCFTGTESDSNNDAIVFRLTYREDTVLFATEPEEPAQELMLDEGVDLRADLLKVPHHGSASSLPEFFQAVDPEVAVVSVGENPYGHPVPSTLEAIAATGARIWRTDRRGTVTVRFDEGGMMAVTSDR